MKKIKTIKINAFFIWVVVFIFLCLIIKLIYVGSGNITVNGKELSEFASNRDTVKKTITAKRGTIYARNSEVLAKDVNSYTVIAYLSESRTKDINRPQHVVDKEMTAEKLSPLLNMSKEAILNILNSKISDCDKNNNCTLVSPYQVELGPGGRGITELLKDKISDLELPGIDFIASTKRYYPNGDFLSFSLGYARRNNENVYQGEMGLELYYNDELTGEDGYIEYQSDTQGYQITSLPSIEKKAISGNDIYLTIDTNIQMFTEQAMAILEESNPEWSSISVMNAKTGEILGVASSPSFDNNTLEIKLYYDPFVTNTYEPGSTMKIFSFMAAMENGIYDGNEKYKSGKVVVDDATIKDWNKVGWGEITYDEGFMASSNVAATNLALKLGRGKLKDFYTTLGFGEKTGITLPNESNGIVNFKYNTELASVSYGQGMTVNAVQMLQALTTLSNDGMMIKPYLVSKIVDSETGDVVIENKREEIRKVCSEDTALYLRNLMRGVVDGSSKISTGTGYYIKGYDLIGKTGTAEIAGGSGYLTGSTNYVRSFAGLFPGDEPEIIIYVAASKMSSSTYLKKAVKTLVKDVGTYLNIYGSEDKNEENIFEISSYINKETFSVNEKLTNANMNPIVIGDGTKIINQYPNKGTKINLGSKIFLLTNASEYKMPNIKGWSRSDIDTFANLINLNVSYSGIGYAKEYNIKKNSIIDLNTTLEVELETKFKDEPQEDSKE
ncbi:MAG: penicillin-binding protein [bacterium]|nr:penicillin-binding protein [bacterium]